jgi:hypothetical protein
MWQEILITDVTQMSGDRVCIAGINKRLENIRPVLPGFSNIHIHQLSYSDFIIRPRVVLRMDLSVKDNLQPPHIEDRYWWKIKETKLVYQVDQKRWKKVLNDISSPSVKDVFGTELDHGKSILPSNGVRSVGVVKLRAILDFEYNVLDTRSNKKGYRLTFTDGSHTQYNGIAITDLALRRYIISTVENGISAHAVASELKQKLLKSEVWLRLGLTRPMYANRCWLQINGIYTFPDYLEGKCFNDFKVTSPTE